MKLEEELHELLEKHWGFHSFREKQKEIILAVLEGRDTLALLPTGGGKTLCYQLPALAKEGMCLVISPLLALIQDQINSLHRRKIKAISITSAMSKREIDISLDNAAYGDYKFLFISPERIDTEIFRERLKKMNISFVAIDEAHCISQWGYDFRPAYLKINRLRTLLQDTPFLALTATATPEVVKDIQEKLDFKETYVIQRSFERKNLAYVVLEEEDQQDRMLKIIDGVKGSGIVYVNSRKKTKQIADYLANNKVDASFYHAGLNHEERKRKQEEWVLKKDQVMVATNAFGMGIDKPNVNFVIHIDLPNSLEAYFQEAGRAGRAGEKAYSVILSNPSVVLELKERAKREFPSKDTIKKVYLALGNYFQIPVGGGEQQSFPIDLLAFSQQYDFRSDEVERCIHFLEKEGLISFSDRFQTVSKVHIYPSKEKLYRAQLSNLQFDMVIKTMLRSYGGLFEGYVKVDESEIGKHTKLPKSSVIKVLGKLKELDVIDYLPKTKLPEMTYLTPRVEQKGVFLSKQNYEERKTVAESKLKAVLGYLEDKKGCRSKYLLQYFGEKSGNCGVCDLCLERKKGNNLNQEENQIRKALLTITASNHLTTKQIVEQLKTHNKELVLQQLSILVDNNQIKTDGYNYSMKINDPNID